MSLSLCLTKHTTTCLPKSVPNLFQEHNKCPGLNLCMGKIDNWKKKKISKHNNIDINQKHKWTKQFSPWAQMKIKASQSKLKRCLWMQRMTLTWWDCLAVFQYTVILECAGWAGCQAVECVHVCVWLMSVRACPKVLGDSREQCGCLWFPDGLYCGGRWYVFLRKRPSPSYATDPPPPLHPHTRTLGTLLITQNVLTVQ